MFIGRTVSVSTDAAVETPVLWPLDVQSQLIGKGPGAGKDRDTLLAQTVKNLPAMQET